MARARLTLGNYLGAVRQMVTAQDEATCVYGGLDPERATLFQQSRLPTHTALAYLLECTAYTGELGRMIQFKEKRRAAGGVGTGTRVSLYTYPVLMAADILLYRPSLVPVGDDQRQHVELTRDLAVRFNHTYGAVFTVPEVSSPPVGARIRDLADPSRKMSKSAASEAGVIQLHDDPDQVYADGAARCIEETTPVLEAARSAIGLS